MANPTMTAATQCHKGQAPAWKHESHHSQHRTLSVRFTSREHRTRAATARSRRDGGDGANTDQHDRRSTE